MLTSFTEREVQETLLVLSCWRDPLEELLALLQELQRLEEQHLVLHPQQFESVVEQAQPVLHPPLHREQLNVRELLQMHPEVRESEELSLLREEELEWLPEPLVERLEE